MVCSPFHYIDKIIEVVEHETCNYTIVVHATALCYHPLFATESKMAANVITCSPLLSEDQYQKYLRKSKATHDAAYTCVCISIGLVKLIFPA